MIKNNYNIVSKKGRLILKKVRYRRIKTRKDDLKKRRFN